MKHDTKAVQRILCSRRGVAGRRGMRVWRIVPTATPPPATRARKRGKEMVGLGKRKGMKGLAEGTYRTTTTVAFLDPRALMMRGKASKGIGRHLHSPPYLFAFRLSCTNGRTRGEPQGRWGTIPSSSSSSGWCRRQSSLEPCGTPLGCIHPWSCQTMFGFLCGRHGF